MRLKVLLIAVTALLASTAQFGSALASTVSICGDFKSGITKASENSDIYSRPSLEYEYSGLEFEFSNEKTTLHGHLPS